MKEPMIKKGDISISNICSYHLNAFKAIPYAN